MVNMISVLLIKYRGNEMERYKDMDTHIWTERKWTPTFAQIVGKGVQKWVSIFFFGSFCRCQEMLPKPADPITDQRGRTIDAAGGPPPRPAPLGPACAGGVARIT